MELESYGYGQLHRFVPEYFLCSLVPRPSLQLLGTEATFIHQAADLASSLVLGSSTESGIQATFCACVSGEYIRALNDHVLSLSSKTR